MKRKRLIRNVFGRKFDAWDLVLILLLGASLFYILKTSTLELLVDKMAWIIFGIAFGALLIRLFKKIMKKARR